MTNAAMLNAMPAHVRKPRLKDLVTDFMSMALMIRRGRKVRDTDVFKAGVNQFFPEFEQNARTADYSAEQVKDAQYALCAFLDESILKAGESTIRNDIELHPFQFKYFGVHLAGEGFFEKLDALRLDVKNNLDVLEIYHLCLALGFAGRYGLEQKDQLRYIANTLGNDIGRYRTYPKVLSPDWKLPDQVTQLLRFEIPLWFYILVITLICGGVFLTLRWLLGKEVDALAEQVSRLFGV